MSQKAAIRRRKQYAKNYRHLPPLQRPKYPQGEQVDKRKNGKK